MIKTDLLIVVDMQNGFVNDKSRIAVEGVVQAVNRARESGVPIVFTRFFNAEGSPWRSLLDWHRLVESPETDLHPSIAPLAHSNEILDKTTYSSVVAEVAELIGMRDGLTIAICGIATDGCVLKTAVDLFERDVRPIVLRDAVASHAGDEVHQAGLLLIQRFIGARQILTVEEWCAAK